jgi:lysyl-tRNA synthetase class 2
MDYPYRYERTATAGELRDRFGELAPGSESGTTARVSGRLMTVRTHGKLAFADLQDASGRIQLFAQLGVLGEEGMSAFESLSVGDIVGAAGEIMTTRRGELSLKVAEVTLLAKCQRSMPEKWHGISDVETRYRQRYLDLISNPVPQRVLVARARANDAVRRFFDQRGFLEVETPLLQPIASGAVARPFVTHHNALDIDLYLRVAPELYLKRLLIGGAERVYELNRSFRNEGVSARHNPEFTMLEAYEAYVDYEDTMALVEDLTKAIAERVNGTLELEIAGEKIDLAQRFERVTMFDAIERATGVDVEKPWRAEAWDEVRAAADDLDIRTEERWGPGRVVSEIYEERVEKTLVKPTFVVGFPKEISPLAKDHRSLPGFTEHADLILGGLEIAPIYSELNDPDEQMRRFQGQAEQQAAGEEDVAVPDEDFVEALRYGMPPAGGFGFGMDRFLTLLLELDSLREVIMFPTLRPEQ